VKSSILSILLKALSRILPVKVIAMISLYDVEDKLVQLEKDGFYAHCAVLINGQWLHAGPRRGVELVDTFESMGLEGMSGPRGFDVDLFFKFERLENISDILSKFLGRPYDKDFTWGEDSTYCSELIAKIFNFAPIPMKFDEELWDDDYKSKRLELGISPDDLIIYLIENQFTKVRFLKNSK
jgi:hypothetical protein